MRILQLIVTRVLAFAALLGLFTVVGHLLPDAEDSGYAIALGFLLFGALWMITFVWGLFDGRRESLVTVGVVWLLVGALTAAGLAGSVALADPEVDWEVFRFDLVSFLQLLMPSILFMAIVGGVIGRSTRPITPSA